MLSLISLLLALFSDVNAQASSTLLHIARGTSAGSVNASVLGSEKVAVAWYAGWHAQDFPLSKVSWEKYTHLAYAFAITTPDVNVLTLGESDEELLPKFVSTAHKNNVKASLSIGGWTGSRWYSSNVGSTENRTAFVNTVLDLVSQYDLDGLDFDWEYPNKQGIGCNVVHENDTANFLSFLQELRQNPKGANLTLTAATFVIPFNDSSSTPSKDVSGFAQVLDWIAIMNYDVYGYLSTNVGPNAPLNDTCAPSGDQFGSAYSSVLAWSDAGFPIDQIVLGVPSYGQSFIVPPNVALTNGSEDGPLALYPEYSGMTKHVGDKWDGAGEDVCGVQEGPSGVYDFWGLVDGGFLNSDGSPQDGIVYTFDNCSQTPFLYNSKTQTMISYDNAASFTAKGEFVGSSGLKGFAIWEAGGDYNNILLDSILSATATGIAAPKAIKKSPSSPNTASSTSSLPNLLAVLALITMLWNWTLVAG